MLEEDIINTITLFLDYNHYSNAALEYTRLADYYKINGTNTNVIDAYVNAFKYYEQDHNIILALPCLLEAAYLLVNQRNYKLAISYLEYIRNYHQHNKNEYLWKNINVELAILHWKMNDLVVEESDYFIHDLEFINLLHNKCYNEQFYTLKNKYHLHPSIIALLPIHL